MTDLKVGDTVRVIPDGVIGTIRQVLPATGTRPTEYRVKRLDGEGQLAKNYWRADQLEKIARQERMEV